MVVPNYNDDKYLPVFLNSLLRQSFDSFELIIVDGGSTDRSMSIIRRYAKRFESRSIPLYTIVDATRNFGYIRNLGAKHAKGEILFHANTDNYFEPRLLEKLAAYYREHLEVLSVSGRVYPLGTSIIAHLGYQVFDLLRFLFTCAPMPLKKYRPSGNFMTMRAETFRAIGGHPEVPANEDGLLGAKFDPLLRENHKVVSFNLDLYVGHWVKKFESMGGIRALLFYLYVLGNFAPILQPFLEPVLWRANRVFMHDEPV